MGCGNLLSGPNPNHHVETTINRPLGLTLQNRNAHIADAHFQNVPLCFPFVIQNVCGVRLCNSKDPLNVHMTKLWNRGKVRTLSAC